MTSTQIFDHLKLFHYIRHNNLRQIFKNKTMCKKLQFIITSFFIATFSWQAEAEDLIILHTNDTHSQIDPLDNGLGGIARRKVLVDSVRSVRKNVLTIDAGDVVQGTLFFTLYGGEVEQKAMNGIGYDIAILGNHEFDNGMEKLAGNIKINNAAWLTTNYDLTGSSLDGLFVPYIIKEYEGRRIGFIGINLDPKGMIADGNYDGVKFLDPYKAANSTAWHLKHNEKTDMVIAITHIGYDGVQEPTDPSLASGSEDIDIIIGGHSHTTLDPAPRVKNAVGKDVLIVQTGSRGANLGEITIDLDNMTATSRLIPVDSRLDSRIDPQFEQIIAPYRASVDSVMKRKIARVGTDLDATRILNLFTDYVLQIGRSISGGDIDMAILNKGGIRRAIPKGNITEGMIITALPFDNRVRVIEIKGSDLSDAIDVMATRGGDGVSVGVEAVIDPATGRCTSVTINGQPIDPDHIYKVATIDYLANGGDYMFPLTKGTTVATSGNILYKDIIAILERSGNKALKTDATKRMHQ